MRCNFVPDMAGCNQPHRHIYLYICL
uniref:Uncharacterized protein n=1 Tax=Anguilla anguilla TaxID=7936 RepID=A0A0E9RKZ8_ANGAN